MSEERLTNLEARYAWLERHVGEQDRAMAELGHRLRRLQTEVETLRTRLRVGEAPAGPEAPEPPPPHY